MNTRYSILILLAIVLISSTVAQDTLESTWSATAPVHEFPVPEHELANASTYGFSLWFRYNYRIPERVDVSHLVNSKTAIAGVTEHESYMNGYNDGDCALSVYLLPFGD
jgi:hypothetical protein